MFHIDYETFSEADLPSVGGWRYAFDPSTEILCCAIAKGEQQPLIWVPEPYRCAFPASHDWTAADTLLQELAASNDPVYAHNAVGFEVPITDALWQRITGLPPIAHSRWRCTAVMARRAALPHSLAKCAEKLGLANQKDNKGSALIRKLSLLQKDGSRIRLTDDPEAFRQFCAYCLQDVRVEQEVHRKLKAFELKGFDLEVFLTDLEINARGLPVNLKALENAQKIVSDTAEQARTEFKEFTGLEPTQGKAFLAWLKERGYEHEDLRAETIDEFLDSDDCDSDGEVGKALQLRQRVSFAATKKLDSFLSYAGPHDNKVRGILMYYGAIRTGRWTSSGPQIQNAKKPKKHLEAYTDQIYRDICRGASAEELEFTYGNPIESVASCIRHFVDDGKPMLNADYSAIEARVLAWLAGEEWRLELFRKGGDIYVASISKMLGVETEQVDRSMRQRGKVAELACIAEGQLVLTDQGLVPIEKVTFKMRVWDGKEFVGHQGLVYRGVKPVITYAGLTATEDHIVWTQEEGQTTLGSAAASRQNLVQSAHGRTPVRVGKDHQSRKTVCSRLERLLCTSSVSGMWDREVDQPHQSAPWGYERVSTMHEAEKVSYVARQAIDRHEATVRESKGQGLQKLWSTGDQVSVQIGAGSRLMGPSESRTQQRAGAGQDRQQRALCRRESEVCGSVYTEPQPKAVSPDGSAGRLVQEPITAVCRDIRETSEVRVNRGHGSKPCNQSSNRVSSEVDGGIATPRLAKVYDLIECGPRNRFTVSGVLVHNCGYSGGTKALVKMGALQIGIPENELQGLVDRWRAANSNIKAFWNKCEVAARAALANPGQRYGVNGKVQYFAARTAGLNYLFARLPSGRHLAYPEPRLEMAETSWGEMRESITFYGVIPGKKTWGRVSTYSGKLVENLTQAVAADLMANGAVQCERQGYRINALIHDEALAYHDEGQTPERFSQLLTTLPDWAKDIPMDAPGGLVPYYRKD